MGSFAESSRFGTFHEAVLNYLEKNNGNELDPADVMFAMGFIRGSIESGNIVIDSPDYVRSSHESRHILTRRDGIFDTIGKNPNSWLVEADMVHMAGGLLPTIFGKEKDPDWERIIANAPGGIFEFAGIRVEIRDLELIGDFARFMLSEWKKLAYCVDERLKFHKTSGRDRHAQIHCDCGACAAIGKQIGVSNLAENLHRRLDGAHPMQPVLDGMPDHESLTIYTDLSHDTRIIDPKYRQVLQLHHALPFHATVPVRAFEVFAKQKGLSESNLKRLIDAWVKLNVQVPRNIIGGHNKFQDLAQHTRHVINTTGVRLDDTAKYAIGQVLQVQHSNVSYIGQRAS